MLPGVAAVQFYGCNDPDFPGCGQPAGERCVNKKGKEVPPHPKRWNLGVGYTDAWDEQQDKINEIEIGVARRDSTISGLTAGLKSITLERNGLQSDLATRDVRITQLEQANAALQQRIDELTRTPDPDPEPTKMLVGAAVGGNADPAPMEKALGKPLDLHRTYWSGAQVDKAVASCKADLVAGRTPWPTFKLPFSWADMAAGKGDAWAKDLGAKLAALNGPVWLDFHHEPEGDGAGATWVAMQQRIIPLATSPNVKVGISLTGYQEVTGDTTWTFEKLWPSKAQFLAVDIYQKFGTVKDGKAQTTWSPLETYFTKVQAFAEKVGVPWGLSETGVTDEALATKPTAVADLFASARGHKAAFLSYFNSSLNSTGSWPLSGAKLADFVKESQ